MARSPASPGPPTTGMVSTFFASPYAVYIAAGLLRAVLLAYGLWQDAHSPIKYTDIDYLVFTDAARFVARGESPYARETYRYTPLLAWLLLPTAHGPTTAASAPALAALLFATGKILFAASDLAAGHLLARILALPPSAGGHGLAPARARRFAAVWLLNPMVAAISTRGSSEGLLGALVAALLWAVLRRRLDLAALLLGLGVHVKIYPFVYAPAVLWWLDGTRTVGSSAAAAGAAPLRPQEARLSLRAFVTPARARFAALSLVVFVGLNAAMARRYGADFVRQTFLHHVTRLDHRHNFSPYHTQLYQASAAAAARGGGGLRLPGVESFAFIPQLLLSTLLIPLVTAKKDLASAMLAQTFAFVTFNKVCTSQVRPFPLPACLSDPAEPEGGEEELTRP